MGSWDAGNGVEYEWPDHELTVEVSDNPVVAELLDAQGNVIRQWLKRPPIGYRRALG